MTARAGQLVSSRFEIEAEIGRGARTVVYRATDRRTGAPVAVKMLDGDAAADPDLTVGMAREYRALVALDGLAAVRAVALGSAADGALCLVMELLDGESLEAHLVGLERGGRRIGVAALLGVLDPVADTLEAAHDLGIVHRGVAAAKIHLLGGGGVRLLDFGLAKVRDADPPPSSPRSAASRGYAAPELRSGPPASLAHRVDVFALGAVVFRALAGRMPFEGAPGSRAATVLAPSLHLLRPDLPPAIDAWVGQALAADPEARFHRVRAMWTSLRSALGLEPRSASSQIDDEEE